MKTGFISFRDVKKPWSGENERALASEFARAGFYLDEIVVLSEEDKRGFSGKFDALKDYCDNLVVVESGDAEFSVKEEIAKCMSAELVQNERAKQYVTEFFASQGMRPSVKAEELSLLPEGATVIPNLLGYQQGFMMEDDDISVLVLPGAQEEAAEMCRQYVIPYIQSKFKIKYDRITLRLFGADRGALEEVLREAGKRTKKAVSFHVEERCSDFKVDVIYNSKTPKMLVDDAVCFLVTELGGKMYAEEDVPLQRRLSDILRVTGKKLSVAESFTGGGVAARIVSVPGASEVLYESVVAYDNGSKRARLGVSAETLKKFGAVSSETVYEMAAGLLSTGKCDVAIATSGIAGPASDDTDKPVGLCYIAVGFADGIHVYRYQLAGDRAEITETATGAAMYLAIKKLREKNKKDG